ncbi:MAG: Long-chain-fatty-acid--CoA ligase [Frankiales bacterium]|jgi:fatty-acyl-CoA synthase|nr:Long-chain-fatty-acid--CoA ligase [Frankiales bacterium]
MTATDFTVPSAFGNQAGSELARHRLRRAQDVVEIERLPPSQLLPALTIHGCIAAAARAAPTKVAMAVVEAPDLLSPVREVSFRDLVASIEQSACLFRATAGDGPSVVGIMLPMVPEGLFGLWGAATAGLAVPLNPHFDIDAVIGILHQVEASALVTSRELWEAKCLDPEDFRRRVPTLRRVFFVEDPETEDDFGTAMRAYAGQGLAFPVDEDPERDAIIMPTGGTTGVPKLVRMSQGGQLMVAWNVGALMGNAADGVVAHGMPNFHVGGSVVLGLRAMITGQTLLTLTSQGFRTRSVVDRFWEIVQHFGVTSVLATPTTALALLDQEAEAPREHRLADFHCGGSVLPMQLVQGFHDRFGIWLRENWGMTELHGTTTGHFDDGQQPRVGSAGRSLPYNSVRAVELDGNQFVRECRPGEPGILVIGGPGVTAGYVRPEYDADFFVVGMPALGRWGNTGDIGSVDEDGYVWVQGRSKDVIIRGGHNIDPKGIEDALCSHPAVQVAAAVGQPSSSKGELPIAYVQLKAGMTADVADLLAHCRSRVQESAAVPVAIVILDELPQTAVGKISKPVLRRRALEHEVLGLVERTIGQGQAAMRVDETGPRMHIVVELPAGTSTADAEGLRQRLVGYEFGSEIVISSA